MKFSDLVPYVQHSPVIFNDFVEVTNANDGVNCDASFFDLKYTGMRYEGDQVRSNDDYYDTFNGLA